MSRVGRPKNKDNYYSVVTRVDEEQYKYIQGIALHMAGSLSQAVRFIIRDYIQNMKEQQNGK